MKALSESPRLILLTEDSILRIYIEQIVQSKAMPLEFKNTEDFLKELEEGRKPSNIFALIDFDSLENQKSIARFFEYQLRFAAFAAQPDVMLLKQLIEYRVQAFFEKPLNTASFTEFLDKLPYESSSLNKKIKMAAQQRKLTPKESEILRLALQGLSNKQISTEAGAAEKTIKVHLTAIFRKFGVSSRTELVSRFIEN